MMKIGFITTIDTNIGDDFIRTGIENIIASIKDPAEIEYTYVNKHLPDTSVVKSSPLHLLKKLPRFKGKNRLIEFFNKNFYAFFSVYKNQDLIIQSGAPVLWPNCQDSEWAQPIWYNTVGKLKNKIPVINLAAGSCYPWENQDGFSNDKEAVYAKDIGGFCRLTTTRDKLANKLFKSVGVENTLMPCTAFFVDKNFSNSNKGDYVLINYMKGAGHFDWGQNVNNDTWEQIMKEVIDHLKKDHEIRFICHTEKEVELAKKTFPGFKTMYPKTVPEYIECIRPAKLGINNRMHASVAMGSAGVPAISICTDTRLLMLENIGMPNFYIKDVDARKLIETSENLLANFEKERKRLFDLKTQKFEEYRKLITAFIDGYKK